MKHTKGTLQPLNQTIPKQAEEKTLPDRSNLADLYPQAHERDGYINQARQESDYQPKFSLSIIARCALLLPLPFALLILGIDYFIRTTSSNNIFIHLPLIVIGLLLSALFIYFSISYVVRMLETLRFNASAYLTLYLLCVAPLIGALFGLTQAANYGSLIVSTGLIGISQLFLISIGFILSRPTTRDHIKSVVLVAMVAGCFGIELLYLSFKLLTQ